MKVVYCSNCGKKLPVFRKAIPNTGIVVDMIEPHECSEEPLELDLKPIAVPSFNLTKPKGKFATKIEELTPSKHFPTPSEVGDVGLRDRRFDRKSSQPTSSAPEEIIRQVKTGEPTEPTE